MYDGIDNVIYRMWGIESIIEWEGLNDSKSLIITIVNNNKNIYNYDIIKRIIEIPIQVNLIICIKKRLLCNIGFEERCKWRINKRSIYKEGCKVIE